MMNIVFIAPPGAGKGTQSELLVNKYNYEHISTGNLLREAITSETYLGNKIKEIMKSGDLVPDDIVTTLLVNKLKSTNKPFILDGYPRNINQVKTIEEELNKLDKKLPIVIYLKVNDDEAVKRITGRLICPECKSSYNKYYDVVKPLIDGICNNCKVNLISRSDDNEEAFKVRYQNYLDSTFPLIKYYKEKGNLIEIEDMEDPISKFKKIEKVIK